MSCECIVRVVASVPSRSGGSWSRCGGIVLTTGWCILTGHLSEDDRPC